jgi:hypothetical protein
MITEDPQLETRLRHYGSILRNDIQATPALHAQIVGRLDQRQPARPHRLVMQLALTAAMILVAVGGVVVVQRVRANELAKAEPRVSSISPADGATGVPLTGEFRVTFAKRPATLPELTHVPADGSQAAARWDGSTLVIGYSGLHTRQRYEVAVKSDYTSAFGGKGHFEKRWAFTTQLGPPSAGAGPLIWYQTSRLANPVPQPTQLIALDWNGAVVGTLTVSGGANQLPDGSRLWVGDNLIDQTGAVVGQLTILKGGPTWGDDSRQRCQMSTASGNGPTGQSSTEPAWLFAGPIGSPMHRVAQVGEYGGQTGPYVAACSPLSDRAVVVQNAIMSAREVWVLRLSTGAVLYHLVYSSQQVSTIIVASHDGRYLAEELISSDPQAPLGFGDTQIRRISDGAIVARLTRQAVVGFSWDGTRVITTPAYQSGAPNEVRVVDWQRSQILWRSSLPQGPQPGLGRVDVLARPDSADVAIAIGLASTNGQPDQYEGIWLVRGDGTARQVVVGQLAPDFP